MNEHQLLMEFRDERKCINELKSTIWTIMLARGMKDLTCICTFLLDC